MAINRYGRLGALSLAMLGGALAGCVGPVERTSGTRVQAPPPPIYEEPWFVPQNGYVYYPDYEVYYSNTRRNFIYQEGGTWVTRPAPPRVPVDVLFASPAVRFDFRASPSVYHPQVMRQFPRDRTPPNSGPDRDRADARGR